MSNKLDYKYRKNIEPTQKKKVEKTQAELLIELTLDMEIFCDDQGDSYVKVKVENRFEVWDVGSEGFYHILIYRYMKKYNNKIPSKEGLNSAIQVLKAKARISGKKEVVYTRIAETYDAIYVDLCNENWEVIEIKAEGWKVISNPPVYFKRSKIMQSLPYPEREATFDVIRSFINISDEKDFKLIIAWLLSTMRLSIPYPISYFNFAR